jgi:type II secretory pathway component HofQ
MRKFLPLIGMTLVALSALAQDAKRFDLQLADADLTAATQMLALRSGLDLQFVFKPSDKPYGRITLNLTGVSVDEAMAFIAEAAGAKAKKNDGGVWVIGHPEDFPVEPVAAPPLVVERPEPKITTKIKLKNYDPKQMIDLLFGYEIDTAGEWKALERFKQLAVPTSGFSVPMTPNMVSASPQGISGGNDIQIPGGADQRRGGLGGGGGAGQLGGGGQGGFGQGGAGQGGQGGQGGGQGNIDLQGGEGFVPDGIEQISYDPTDNSIIVRGTDSAIQELERLIARFDVRPRQVEIKVEFVTTSNSLENSFGIDWLFQRGAVLIGNTPGTQARAGDPFFVNFATGGLTTRLRALLLEGYGTVVNAPFVRTPNNQPATIFQSIQTVIFLSQTTVTNVGVIQTVQPFPITAQSVLQVKPRINADDTITISIAPTLAEFGQVRRGPDGSEIPDLLQQGIQVTTIVENGETVVLGGLNRKQETNTFQRFPILSEIPIIGNLFRSTARRLNNQELLIFITPRIVEPDGSYSGG